jgi:hypothetical protein
MHGEKRNAYRILDEESQGRDHSGKLGVGERIM